ncbi:MAG: Na/Pi cotransporter family protein [Clostridia bacterium]|nr:Na/Pi cotransporter family protein [Clostridia bacterium]
MDFTNVLSLAGGLALFLFGMNLMGEALEKSAGNKLKGILETLTSSRLRGLLLGIGVTAVIQSSSATTVMVVGFVNSGIMALKQAISVIMGANIGTTVTAWILSLTGISGDNFFITMLKPTSFTPILAVIGVILYMFIKNERKKDIGLILLGFSVLMFGMDSMSAAVKPLAEIDAFRNIFLMFSNPILGVIVGALVTAIIQSSSASVGILQALSATGMVTVGSTIPIIMGQNIGTCVTALLSSVGANTNARRAAMVHLYFNIIGTFAILILFYALNAIFRFEFINTNANQLTIAVAHSTFNILCTSILLPFTGFLEKLAIKTVPDKQERDKNQLLDERLLATPTVAIERCKNVAKAMAQLSVESLKKSFGLLTAYDEKILDEIHDEESRVDKYEDAIGTYLVRLTGKNVNAKDGNEVTELLHLIGDFERLSDHAVNIAKSAREKYEKKIVFSEQGEQELKTMVSAVSEILDKSLKCFERNDTQIAAEIEPLEQVIDGMRTELKKRHVARLQQGQCTIEVGFVFSDIITYLERIADHCSNIGGCVIEIENDELMMHDYTKRIKDSVFNNKFDEYQKKYAL